MPKIIELTVEIEVQKVSCPGVWLCQDGRVSLTIYALGTSYQTCLLPPIFPLHFKDVFYFKRRFQETCAVNNICCLLKNETIYCELVQWSDDCSLGSCVILSQYLGNLGDVLFPPNMCSNDGVDLLMRRTKEFPGILSPKIEITTKVRIDEVWNPKSINNGVNIAKCSCSDQDSSRRQKQVCHSSHYHRNKCTTKSPGSRSRSHSGSRSCGYPSQKNDPEIKKSCYHEPSSSSPRRQSPPIKSFHQSRSRTNQNKKVDLPEKDTNCCKNNKDYDCWDQCKSDSLCLLGNEKVSRRELNTKMLLDSRYIDSEQNKTCHLSKSHSFKITPCVCEICRKYHELFHINS